MMIMLLYLLLIQAVKILLASRDNLQKEKSNQENIGDSESQLDPIHVSVPFAN